MKRLLTTAFIACTLLASPVLAQTPGEGHHDHHRADHHHAQHREHHKARHDHGHRNHHE